MGLSTGVMMIRDARHIAASYILPGYIGSTMYRVDQGSKAMCPARKPHNGYHDVFYPAAGVRSVTRRIANSVCEFLQSTIV